MYNRLTLLNKYTVCNVNRVFQTIISKLGLIYSTSNICKTPLILNYIIISKLLYELSSFNEKALRICENGRKENAAYNVTRCDLLMLKLGVHRIFRVAMLELVNT